MEDSDLKWLKGQRPSEDLLGIAASRVSPVVRSIYESNPDSWPMTIGLFGSWGSGKTTYLSYLIHKLEHSKYKGNQPYDIVYFNAWKYAGFMEIVPALIYKILKYTGATSNEEIVVRLMMSLGKKYSDQMGEWAKKYIGINPSDLVKDIIDIKNATDPKAEILEQYYTQLDQAQDLLVEHFSNHKSPVIVIIDELDRCDPGEAFDVIKQLRIFFSMREIPVIFILSANPEPIGLAVKHQYGLKTEINDYEAKRILEKFVDTYIDMSDPLSLKEYIKHIWRGHNISKMSVVHSIDQQFTPSFIIDPVRNTDVFGAITTGNYLYSNLRILEKSYKYVTESQQGTNLLWTAWHLEILSQIHDNLRRTVVKLSSEISSITAKSLANTINELKSQNVISSTWKVTQSAIIKSDKGETAFAVYRSWFWDMGKDRLDSLRRSENIEDNNKSVLLEGILKDHHVMDFIIIMSLFQTSGNISPNDVQGDGWRKLNNFEHYSWLLANY